METWSWGGGVATGWRYFNGMGIYDNGAGVWEWGGYIITGCGYGNGVEICQCGGYMTVAEI